MKINWQYLTDDQYKLCKKIKKYNAQGFIISEICELFGIEKQVVSRMIKINIGSKLPSIERLSLDENIITMFQDQKSIAFIAKELKVLSRYVRNVLIENECSRTGNKTKTDNRKASFLENFREQEASFRKAMIAERPELLIGYLKACGVDPIKFLANARQKMGACT